MEERRGRKRSMERRERRRRVETEKENEEERRDKLWDGRRERKETGRGVK